MVRNMHPLAIDAENEWKEEQAALATIDRSRYVYKFRPSDSEAMDALAGDRSDGGRGADGRIAIPASHRRRRSEPVHIKI
jgi:hypothetical protein